MTMWLAVLAACAVAYLLKLGGYLVPHSVLETPWVARVTMLLPVALLAALVVTQALLSEAGTLVLDARAGGVAAAVVALLLRAPFLLVIVLAAVTSAALRLAGLP